MSKLDSEQEIIKLAAGLQVDWQKNAVQNIIALCHKKIANWRKDAPTIASINQLENLICKKLKIVFEEVWSNEDLASVVCKYVRQGEAIFATLTNDLNEKTFAALIERRKIDGNSSDRYVAVIDCRGSKSSRRFFTRWHEIAHLLTLQGQLELPLHRSTTDKNPTERLMDVIAGEIGFFEPLFRPILHQEIATASGLTFGTVERIRERFCPEASYESTLNACVNRMNSPVLLITLGLALKKDEQRQLQSPQTEMFLAPRPQSKLRVLSVAPSSAARGTTLQIHRNMQVPESSSLFRMFFNLDESGGNEVEATENLSTWRHTSDGSSLANVEVIFRARRIKDTIVALVSPVTS
jgi:hypothetical protein